MNNQVKLSLDFKDNISKICDLINRKYHTNMVNPNIEITKAINKQVEELGWLGSDSNEYNKVERAYLDDEWIGEYKE